MLKMRIYEVVAVKMRSKVMIATAKIMNMAIGMAIDELHMFN